MVFDLGIVTKPKLSTVELSVLEGYRGGGQPQGAASIFYFCIFAVWAGRK